METEHPKITGPMTRRRALQGSAVAGLGLFLPSVLAACGSSPGAGTTTAHRATSDRQIGNLTWAHSAPPASLDFSQSWDYTTPLVLSNSIEGLLVLDQDWSLKPNLATGFERPDSLTYVFTIRKGVTFWDGTPLRPEDVIFSYMRNLDPKLGSQTAVLFQSIRTMKKTGPDEITIRLKTPDPFLQFVAAHPAGGILSQAYVEKQGAAFGTPQGLTMGTGPMQIDEFVGASRVTSSRFDGYWSEPSRVSSLTHTFIVDDQARLLALRSGQANGSFTMPPNAAVQAARVPNLTVTTKPSLQSHIYELDMAAGPTADINFRKAVFYSVDRDGLVNSVLRGMGEPSSIEVPPQQWGALSKPSDVEALYGRFPTPEFDLEKAEGFLAKSGTKSATFRVTYASSLQRVGQGLQSTAANLEQIGVRLDVKEVPDAQWFAEQAEHKTGFRASIWVPDYPDPADYPSFNYPSSAAVPGQYNMGNLRSAKVDRLLKAQAAELNPQKRAETIGEMLEYVSRQFVYIPVWWEEASMVLSDDLVLNEYDAFVGYRTWATQLRSAA